MKRGDNEKAIHIRLPRDDRKFLEKIAERYHVSMSQALRWAISWAIAGGEGELSEIFRNGKP